jgi:hypothetical protein
MNSRDPTDFQGDRARVVPLGVFGVLARPHEMEELREELRALSGAILAPERESIANYLRSGAVVVALMEYTRDVLGNAFGVSGGSGIHTDGVYYWRRDAAEYVYHYGIGLPADFVEHGRHLQWVPRSLSQEQIAAIDHYLVTNMRTSPQKF